MKALLVIVIASPLVAIAIAAMRIGQRTIDESASLLTTGLFVVLCGVAVFLACLGVAKIVEAWQPKASHQIDLSTQNVDARRQIAVVDAAGRTVELPAGQRIMEYTR